MDNRGRIEESGARREVVLNGRFYSAVPTGVHRVARELVAALDRRRASEAEPLPMRVVCPPGPAPLPRLATIAAERGGRLTSHAWEQLELPALSRGGLLVNLCNMAPIFGPSAITLIHDAQVFSSPRSYAPAFRAWYRIAQPRLARASTLVLTVSEFSRAELVRYGVAPAEKIAVVHNGCDHVLRIVADPDALAVHGLEARTYVVGLASTQAHKNVGLLLAAFARPELQGLKLVLYGSAGAADFEAEGYKVPANVVFAGRIPDEAMRALFESAICVAFPSLTEGFGLPPLEAMRLGCPAIVAPCGAMPEVYGEGALYADPAAPEAWAAGIAKLSSDPVFREVRREAGLACAEAYSWDRAAGELAAHLDRLAGGLDENARDGGPRAA